MVYYIGSSKGQQDGAVKFFLSFVFELSVHDSFTAGLKLEPRAQLFGVYKLLAEIRVLQEWANTVYRDWFNEILGTT